MPGQLNPNLQPFLGKSVAGVDEVGRGSLCGDVVAAAVVLFMLMGCIYHPGIIPQKQLLKAIH